MLNKKILLGSLVAGAFLLPLTAGAGVVNGPCVNCHTMHASQDGTTTAPNAQLLLGSGCVTCHAHAEDNGPAGVSAGVLVPAPQVDGIAGALVNPNAGGFFQIAAATDEFQHNNLLVTAGQDGILALTPPGGAVMATQIDCANCHQGSGGHHGTGNAASARVGNASNATYRMLWNGVNGVAVASGSATYGTNDATQSAYLTGSADNINTFCATCHGTFHGANQGSNATNWVRHPTDWSLAEADVAVVAGGGAAFYSANYAALPNTGALSEAVIPVGSNGADVDDILCITCHRPHGSDQFDTLRFVYANNTAGDATADFGCESCHGVK